MAWPSGSFQLFVNNIIALGLAVNMLSTVVQVTARGKIYSLEARRDLVEAAPDATFDVTTFGAKVNDPMFDNAQAFIQAWNAACKKGPGPAKVVIPPGNYMAGQVELVGPCTANPITVEVQGTIQAVTDPSLYPNGDWFSFDSVSGVVLKGGIFDGQGATVWHFNDCKANPNCQHLPITIHFSKATNIIVDGVTSLNAMGFHTAFTFSSDITITNLNVTAPGDSPNTDGVHISTTNNLAISNSYIATGDDCLGIIQGTNNITVTNVHCGPGHGISIGSLGKYPVEKDVTAVHVNNCTLMGTTNGVRIKSFPGKLQLHAHDIIFEDIVMDNAQNPIIIDQSYGVKNSLQSSSVKISDVHFRNIRGTSASPVAVSLACSGLFPCEGIELADIDLVYNGVKQVPMSASCTNTKPIFAGKQNPPPCPVV